MIIVCMSIGDYDLEDKEKMTMSNVDIYLNSTEDAVDFVRCVGRHPYNADIVHGNSMVDAKSIMGVLGMAVGKKVQLCIYEDKADDLIQEMEPYISKASLR